MRVLSSSNSDDGEDGDDNDNRDSSDSGDGGDGDDNNGGNNSAYRETYSLKGHMQGLSLTSAQHYDVGYIYDYRPQLERFTKRSTSTSTMGQSHGFGRQLGGHRSTSVTTRLG